MMGQFQKAFQFLDQVIRVFPKFSHLTSMMMIGNYTVLTLTLLGDYKGALEVCKEIRIKEMASPFSLFIKVNVIILEWLIEVNESDNDDMDAPRDIDKLRIDTESLEAVCSGSSFRCEIVPFDVGYKIIEHMGIGYENILASICLMKALKVYKSINSSNTDEEVATAKGHILSLCNAGLTYLRSYLDDDDDSDDVGSGNMIVKIQALWCKARINHVLLEISSNVDEKLLLKKKITKLLGTVDGVTKLFFEGYSDSYMKLLNTTTKMELLGDEGDENRRNYITEQYMSIIQKLEEAEMYESSSELLLIIQRFKVHCRKQLIQLTGKNER